MNMTSLGSSDTGTVLGFAEPSPFQPHKLSEPDPPLLIEHPDDYCHGCGMSLSKAPSGGVVFNDVKYCCQECAYNIGCSCHRHRRSKKHHS